MTRGVSVPRDAAVRERATTDLATNFVVSAGAGTGKTSLLVERALHAIGSGAAPLHAIAIITFTDKAAGELRHRLATGLDGLRDLASGAAADDGASVASRALARLLAAGVAREAVATRAARELFRLDHASVSTIHGLCSEILRAHPLESGLAPGFAANGGGGARRAAVEAWLDFLHDELGPGGSRAALWARVLATVTPAEAREIALALSGGGIPDDVLASEFPAFDLRVAASGEVSRLADALGTAAAATVGLTDAPRAWMLEAEAALRAFAKDGPGAARAAVEASHRIPGAMPALGKKVAGDEARALEELEAGARPWLAGLARLDEHAAADVFEAVRPFARRLREHQLRSGVTDFDGLLVRTRDLLRDHLEVREAIKGRFRMILLDEFQDTDPVQYEIVLFAAERAGEGARDAYATRVTPGCLFIVGDAKQSIYRFRGADYTAYRRAVGHVLAQGGEELTLSSNFRSVPGILAPINRLFEPGSTHVWRAGTYLPEYVSIRAERTGGASPGVEVWTAGALPDASAAERRRFEGEAIAAEIARLAGAGRERRYEDVLVLLRGFSDVAIYLRAFRERDIPFVVSGGKNFLERTEVVQALAVLRAVADADDAVALLAFLRSPAGGVPDTELAAHAAAGGTWTESATADPAHCPALAAAFARLGSLREAAAHLPVDTAVRHLLERSGLVALSGLAFEASQRVANLERLAQAAAEAAADGKLSLLETVDALEESFEADAEGDSPLADETMDAVRVMTIHRAKGLEADVVILADAAAGRSHRGERRWRVRMLAGPGGSFVRLDGPGFRNAAGLAAAIEDERHEAAEDVRLLYVALTRARERVIVLGGESRGAAPWIDALRAWGYDPAAAPADGALLAGGAVLHRVVGAPPRASRGEARRADGAPDAVVRWEEAATAVVARAARPFLAPSRSDDRGAGAWGPTHGERAPELAREAGSLVHARLAAWDLRDVASLVAGLGADEASREADAVLRSFAASPLCARLRALDIAGREVPMLLDESAGRWRGSIDLIYRDAGGELVVADYKTDATTEGAAERHAPQLGVYVRALERAIPGARVRAELWMLRDGTTIVV